MMLATSVLRMMRVILSRVGLFVVVVLHKLVVAARDQSTQERTNPVYPMIMLKVAVRNGRPE